MPSKQAQIIARTMRRMNLKKIISIRMRTRHIKNTLYEEPTPAFRLKHSVNIYKIDGFKCVHTTASKNTNSKYHIIYFHGGSYTMPAVRTHWHIVDGIISRTNTELTFVNYPLSPEYKCTDTIDLAYKVYDHIAKTQSKNIILMGDSAGGGLALALAQYINNQQYEIKPKKIVLLSPWLDISMDNNISDDLIKRDLLLDSDTLKYAGKRYAGGMDVKNPLCSPLYGSLENLENLAIFIGTSDILYSQCEILREKMQSQSLPISYYPYEDMHHVWVGYPIPEAIEAFDKIAEFINK